MGICGINEPPDILEWERKYLKHSISTVIIMSLFGYDNWYWWSGMHKMKHTYTPIGTQGFFTYFGRKELFGWINIPIKIWVGFALLCFTEYLIQLWSYGLLQRRIDKMLSPERFKDLSEKWLQEIDPRGIYRPSASPESDSNSINNGDDSQGRADRLSPQPIISRHQSSASRQSHSSRRSASRESCQDPDFLGPAGHRSPHPRSSWSGGRDEKKETRSERIEGMENQMRPAFPSRMEPEQRLHRTFSDRMKQGILGWTSSTPVSSLRSSHQETDPTFQSLYEAHSLLGAIDTCTPTSWRRVRLPISLTISCIQLIPLLLTHRLRPRLMIALLGHLKNTERSRKNTIPQALVIALRHPAYKQVSSLDVSLVSRVQLSLHSQPPIPRSWLLLVGYTTFCTCSLIVIGTELAINWNYITNVNYLDSVGQMIPFSLGVGGLIKVLWSALVEREADEKWCFGKCRSVRRRQLWIEASKMYETAEKAWEKKKESETESKREELGA